MMATTPNEVSSKNNRISFLNDKFQDLKTKFFFNKLPENFEAIILSGEPEQHNSAEELQSFGKEFEESNDNRFYFVRIMPMKVQGVILPNPFLAKTLDVAKRLINAYPLAYIEVNNSVHPPTHGDVYECRLTTKDFRGIALTRRLRNSGQKIGKISNREIHKAFRGLGSSGTIGGSQSSGGQQSGTVSTPSGVRNTLAPQTPVLTAANYGQPEKTPPDTGMACSVLTCIWALNQMGKAPSDPQKWARWQNWQPKDPDFWRRCQIYGKEDDGSDVEAGSIINIKAYQQKLGGSYVAYTREQTSTTEPVLTRGRWHIVQRWTPRKQSPEEYATGHSYLVYWDGGETVRYVDSSHKNKYRDRQIKKTNWWKKGSEETVLTTNITGT